MLSAEADLVQYMAIKRICLSRFLQYRENAILDVEQFATADLLAVMLFAGNGAKRHASWRKPLSSTVICIVLKKYTGFYR
jgi:hypothetical protein